MRFNVYKSMLDMCNTLKEAVSYMYENNSNDLVNGCLDMLVSISTTLSDFNITDIESVNVISVGLNSQDLNLPEIYNNIIDLENEIKTKVKYKLHILFVAELAGKWDSMASVYEAMKKREDCEVEVVIQPIFRAVKNPDGSVKSDVILNDYLTPMGIANTPYDQYDFATKLPDITFFSQPYESCTIEKFWPENMAQFTKVVYLPYYTAMTINPNLAVAGYHSFFKSNTERFSWKIVSQSEKMRYHYKNLGSQKGTNVLVTGLPKWDYPMKLSKENTPCPEEWKTKINGRKVFLWNTHFSANTSGSDFLNKGEEFLNIFIKNKNIALIWRPHPMTETILKLYMSDSLSKYNALKEKILKSENIVMDTEATYDAAFVYSDALITDLSSLIEQYLLMDKPVLMSTNKPISEAREIYAVVDGLYDFSKIPFANAINDKKDFVEKISKNIDDWKNERAELIEKYFELADGKCGERVTEKILKVFKEENEDREFEINPAKTALIIGSLKDSEVCIKQFQKNGVEFVFAKELVKEPCDFKTVSFLEAVDNDFDLFVITEKNAAIIKDILKEQGVSDEKILLFWSLYNAGIPTMVCDKIMMNPNVKEYDGCIIGLSHAEVGVIPSMLNGTFCNLAVSSQDIYYQYKTLEYCFENYPEKFRNLKCVVIDLCDYNYFNYDNSLSNSALNYINFGGFNLDAHNFLQNKSFDGEYAEIVEAITGSKLAGLTDVNIVNWTINFPDVYELANYEGFNSVYKDLSNRTNVVSDTQINNYQYSRGVVTHFFEKTIKENVETLGKMFDLLLNINPEMRIYTIIIPKFIEVEARDAKELLKHEKKFFEIIEELKGKYNFNLVDFKKSSNIMYNRNYYFDANHLNYYGAMCLTKELNDIMFNK